MWPIISPDPATGTSASSQPCPPATQPPANPGSTNTDQPPSPPPSSRPQPPQQQNPLPLLVKASGTAAAAPFDPAMQYKQYSPKSDTHPAAARAAGTLSRSDAASEAPAGPVVMPLSPQPSSPQPSAPQPSQAVHKGAFGGRGREVGAVQEPASSSSAEVASARVSSPSAPEEGLGGAVTPSKIETGGGGNGGDDSGGGGIAGYRSARDETAGVVADGNGGGDGSDEYGGGERLAVSGVQDLPTEVVLQVCEWLPLATCCGALPATCRWARDVLRGGRTPPDRFEQSGGSHWDRRLGWGLQGGWGAGAAAGALGEAWWRRRAEEELRLPTATLAAIQRAGISWRDAVLAHVILRGAPPPPPPPSPSGPRNASDGPPTRPAPVGSLSYPTSQPAMEADRPGVVAAAAGGGEGPSVAGGGTAAQGPLAPSVREPPAAAAGTSGNRGVGGSGGDGGVGGPAGGVSGVGRRAAGGPGGSAVGGTAGGSGGGTRPQPDDWYDEVYELMYGRIEEERQCQQEAEAAEGKRGEGGGVSGDAWLFGPSSPSPTSLPSSASPSTAAAATAGAAAPSGGETSGTGARGPQSAPVGRDGCGGGKQRPGGPMGSKVRRLELHLLPPPQPQPPTSMAPQSPQQPAPPPAQPSMSTPPSPSPRAQDIAAGPEEGGRDCAGVSGGGEAAGPVGRFWPAGPSAGGPREAEMAPEQNTRVSVHDRGNRTLTASPPSISTYATPEMSTPSSMSSSLPLSAIANPSVDVNAGPNASVTSPAAASVVTCALAANAGGSRALLAGPAGRWLVLAGHSDDHNLLRVDLSAGGVKEMRGHTRGVRDIAVDGAEGLLASAGWDNRLIVWELQDCSIRHFFHLPNLMGGYGYIRYVAVGGGKVAVAQVHALMVYHADCGDVYDVIVEDRFGAGRPDQQRIPSSLCMQYVRAMKITPNGRWLVLATSAPQGDRYHVYDLMVRAFACSLLQPAGPGAWLPLDETLPVFCTLQEDLLVTVQRRGGGEEPVETERGLVVQIVKSPPCGDTLTHGSVPAAIPSAGAGDAGLAHGPLATSPPPLIVWDLKRGCRTAEVKVVAPCWPVMQTMAPQDPTPIAAAAATTDRLAAAVRTASARHFVSISSSPDGTRLYLLDGGHQLWILDLAAGQVLVAAAAPSRRPSPPAPPLPRTAAGTTDQPYTAVQHDRSNGANADTEAGSCPAFRSDRRSVGRAPASRGVPAGGGGGPVLGGGGGGEGMAPAGSQKVGSGPADGLLQVWCNGQLCPRAAPIPAAPQGGPLALTPVAGPTGHIASPAAHQPQPTDPHLSGNHAGWPSPMAYVYDWPYESAWTSSRLEWVMITQGDEGEPQEVGQYEGGGGAGEGVGVGVGEGAGAGGSQESMGVGAGGGTGGLLPSAGMVGSLGMNPIPMWVWREVRWSGGCRGAVGGG